MFQAALKKLRITPDQAVHIGDSREADVRGAALAKMTGLHYPRRDNAIEAVFQRERTLADTDGQAASLGSLRVLARRNGATYAQPWRGYYQDGAFLLGPPLARFADWAVEQCRRENVTRVLVLMREGHTLLPLLRQSSRAAGFPLDLALFYASRHSVNMASLNDITPEMLFEKIHKHTTVSARVLIETLGLNPDLIKEIDPATMDSVLNEAERFTLATLLAGHPVYNPTLKALALQARQAFLGYALPLLEGHERVAMVDIGFRGTIQHSFDNLLRLENHPARTMGLYFCTQAAAAQKVIDGSDIRSYLGGLGADQHLMRVLFTHPEILEQSVNATCGSTLGYVQESDGSYRPQLDAAHLPFEQLYKRHLIQQGIHEFQRLWLECVTSRRKSGDRPVLDAACLEEIDREVIAILRRLWSFPTPEEAGRLGSLFHDDNNGTDTGGIICSDPCRAAFREGGLEKLYNSNAYWPQGIIGLESPGLIEHIFALKHRLELP